MKIRIVGNLVVSLTAACLCISSTGFAAEQTPAGAQAKARPGRSKASRGRVGKVEARGAESAPTFSNVSYGPDESNVYDFWRAPAGAPNPVLLFIHGGGFRAGSKSQVDTSLLQACLRSGISFAAIEYRLSQKAPYPAQMHDCARALQQIRSKAAEYGIDPARVASTGGSAGAGISQWLAFHDDLADPKSADPVARQSTRLACAPNIAGLRDLPAPEG